MKLGSVICEIVRDVFLDIKKNFKVLDKKNIVMIERNYWNINEMIIILYILY